MTSAGKRVFAQFTKRRAFIEAFYKVKTMDDNQKKFIKQLEIDTKFFRCAFANPCTM
jgi:hypothetical protein